MHCHWRLYLRCKAGICSLIRTANKTYAKFQNNHIEDIKLDFLNKYDLDTFIGFLNIISKENHININDTVINKSIKEGKRIKNFRYLSRGCILKKGVYIWMLLTNMNLLKHLNVMKD